MQHPFCMFVTFVTIIKATQAICSQNFGAPSQKMIRWKFIWMLQNKLLSKRLSVATSWNANWAVCCSSFKEISSASVNNGASKVDMLLILKKLTKIFPKVFLRLLSELYFREKVVLCVHPIITNKSTTIHPSIPINRHENGNYSRPSNHLGR